MSVSPGGAGYMDSGGTTSKPTAWWGPGFGTFSSKVLRLRASFALSVSLPLCLCVSPCLSPSLSFSSRLLLHAHPPHCWKVSAVSPAPPRGFSGQREKERIYEGALGVSGQEILTHGGLGSQSQASGTQEAEEVTCLCTWQRSFTPAGGPRPVWKALGGQ